MNRPPLSRKPVRLLIIFTLAFIVSLPIIHPFQGVTAQSPDQSQYYNTTFAWDYGGNHWDWNLSIPAALYNAYVAVPDSVRTQYGLADFGFFTTTQDNYIQTLSNKLNDSAMQSGYGSYDEVNFVLAFVQSIPYKTDNASTAYQDYPRFPVETLVDNVGDCKSHSILFATLMLIMGYDTVFINPPDHLAVGILGNNLQGSYWTYNNKTYYYCETTGVGFKIGELPPQFTGNTANVYSIDESEQYVPNLQATSLTEPNPTISPNTSSPTFDPNPMASPSPTIAGPTIQPVLPVSFNLISGEPVLFILIILAIVISITITVKSANKSKQKSFLNQTLSPEPSSPNMADGNLESNKFCIYCGSSNKSFALYCEKCGKKIA
jgi:hypothetical protein